MMRAPTHVAVLDADETRLHDLLSHADPVPLLAETRTVQNELGKRVDERTSAATVLGANEPPAPSDRAQFTASRRA